MDHDISPNMPTVQISPFHFLKGLTKLMRWYWHANLYLSTNRVGLAEKVFSKYFSRGQFIF